MAPLGKTDEWGKDESFDQKPLDIGALLKLESCSFVLNSGGFLFTMHIKDKLNGTVYRGERH